MPAHAIIESERHPADFHTGFELGWDHARFRVTPPAAQLSASSPVYQGFRAGQGAFGKRARVGDRHVRQWLALRLGAWLRGHAFEPVQVTPNHLAQIDVDHCPITREPLTHGAGLPSDAVVARVRDDAAFAAGNLAVLSTRASQARAACGAAAARLVAPEGLDAAQSARLAALTSYVTALPHEQALALPLLVLPPNRLRLLNPIQALQVLVTLQLTQPGYSARLDRLEALIPGDAARRDFRLFFLALLPRVLEAGPLAPQAQRWALEDAWLNPLVNTSWQRFARQISAAQAEAVVARAARQRGLLAQRFAPLGDEQAIDGWALASGGNARRAVSPQRADAAGPHDATRAAADRRTAPRHGEPTPLQQATLDLAVH